jgi:hypothetical protein
MRVAILVTGQTEWLGLGEDVQREKSTQAGAFKRLFPNHDFYVLPSRDEVRSAAGGFPCAGFTSSPLSEKHEGEFSPENAADLVSRAARAVLGDRRASAADLVVIIDDLELANAHQADRVARVFRNAVIRHIGNLNEPIASRTRDAFRTRVSFHLLAPMVEALFFADPNALEQAGVKTECRVTFAPDCDPENFQTHDEAYLKEETSICHCLLNLPTARHRNLKPKWFNQALRARHPKGYLQWLCRNGTERSCTSYHETEGGARALAGLHWPSLLGRPTEHFQYLRALLADLAEGLGEEPTIGPVPGTQAPITSRAARRTSPVLRNL